MFEPSEVFAHKLGGTHKIYRFDNGFGASVVRFPYSYGYEDGLWELAVVIIDGDDWHLTYDTPVANDVLGHLTEEEVQQILGQIAALELDPSKTRTAEQELG